MGENSFVNMYTVNNITFTKGFIAARAYEYRPLHKLDEANQGGES